MTIITEVWVMDSSPLILLAKIGLLPLTLTMTFRAVIPQAVLDEINDVPEKDLARLAVNGMVQTGGLLISNASISPKLRALRLGKGETAVLAEVQQRPDYSLVITAVLDDQEARNAAKSLGIPTIGTAGILIRAKDDGLIPALSPYLHQLRAAGMWASDAFYRQVASSVGEDWP